MHFLGSVTALTILFLSVQAKPISTITQNNSSPDGLFTPSPQNSVNDCGDSSFTNNSSGGSPRVDDCLQITANIAGGGTWTTQTGPTARQLVSYGTCAFNVRGDQRWPDYIFKVGNQDIIDLIYSSIDKFQWNGLVGASGTMNCQVEAVSDGVPVYWGLYHT